VVVAIGAAVAAVTTSVLVVVPDILILRELLTLR
jgi:hypothetical protein